MKAWSKCVSVVAAAVVVLAVPGVAVANRVEYGALNPWSAPERLDYCGAHFYRYAEGPRVGMFGDGAVVTKAQALSVASTTALVAHGSTGMFGQWSVFVPAGFACPQNSQDVLDSWMFVSLGPDRYLELTDAA